VYHGRVKGLTDSEANQLLEKIYTEWYVSSRGQAENNSDSSPGTQAHQASTDKRPLSKIEETVLTRSI